ncbi:MAG: DNA polymerase I [Selenomonadaceae bacterium]|nr:DNA polymerase I [Selenomonadaceae bacterium]
MKKFLIVDGSSIFYRAFYAMPPLTAPNGTPTGAVVGFANIILKILREQSPDFAAVALDTAKKTFRNEIFSDYKATRPPMPDDLAAQLPLLKEFIEVLGLKNCAAAGYEADDIIGTLATQACKNFKVVILTGDRDALQLINATTKVLLNKKSDVEIYDEKKFVDEYGFAPPLLVDYKGLRGDPSDNIPGVKGIGEKTATTLIKDFGSLENVIARRDEIKSKKVHAALENFADDAVLSKRLAQIVCNVPEIIFSAEDFKIEPDLERVDEFCGRYALAQAKKKIHEFFGTDDLFHDVTKNFLGGSELQPIDFEKIFAAGSLIVAQRGMEEFAVKILDGEIFSGARADLQKVFNEFGGKIILSGVKDYLKSLRITHYALRIVFDVELAAYLLYPEMESYTCEKLLPLEFDGLQMADSSLAANAAALEKLAALYEKKLAAADLTRLYSEIELPLTKVLARMEERGVVVNKRSLKEKSAEMSERIDALRENIYELAGETFNINSSQQLANVLFGNLNLPPVKKTKTGYSTNAEVLEELRWRHPIVEAILNYRALTKLKSTYLDGVEKLIGADGRIHTNFNQTVTATGRLSSSDPNLQNIPVRTDEGREIRALFVPGEGYDCIFSADYSQIELRLLAHMSGDENLIDAFIKEQDIHARTASEVFGVPLEDVTPDLRHKAKAVNFGIVYGISDYGLSRDLHISRKEAGKYIALYFERYPGVKKFLDATVAQAHLHGYVTTMFGRRRFLPAINSKNFNQRSLAERMAMNTPIQGSAADIIKLAMIRAEENLRGLQSRIIIQVHDELVLEAKKSELADVEKILRESMENVAELSVPLIVDCHGGANWSLAK